LLFLSLVPVLSPTLSLFVSLCLSLEREGG
jgi:hypothetical protein